jgi:endonuclease/exonuclease/phosphatase family metal-dependent hydrolase
MNFRILIIYIQLVLILYLSLFEFVILNNWIIDLLSYGVLKALILLILISIFGIVTRLSLTNIIVSIIALLFCIKPIKETYGFSLSDKHSQKSDFTLMNYNVAWFDTERDGRISDSTKIINFYNWIRNIETPDILCLQEFYHNDLDDYYNTLDSIALLGGYSYYYLNPEYSDFHGGIVGNAIFSKFPSSQSKQIKYSNHIVNKGNFHDFIIGEDTIRIVNVHIASMNIRLLKNAELSIIENLSANIKNIFSKLKIGYLRRKVELEKIENSVHDTNYPIIICGDFNSIPYSFTYQKLKRRYYNSFEKKGQGFGFTYNRFPWLIRIDNQFFDKKLKINYFKTYSDNNISDHYPIMAGYSFR